MKLPVTKWQADLEELSNNKETMHGKITYKCSKLYMCCQHTPQYSGASSAASEETASNHKSKYLHWIHCIMNLQCSINASRHQCISASMHQCIQASVHQCINASMYQSINASVYQCIRIQALMHRCIKHQCINASVH